MGICLRKPQTYHPLLQRGHRGVAGSVDGFFVLIQSSICGIHLALGRGPYRVLLIDPIFESQVVCLRAGIRQVLGVGIVIGVAEIVGRRDEVIGELLDPGILGISQDDVSEVYGGEVAKVF